MGRILRRLKLGKKNKLVFEAALAVLFIILFIGVLGGITATYKTPILTTEDLWKLGNVTYVSFGYVNSTTGDQSWPKYRLSDVATYYGGYLYITIPEPPAGYDRFFGFSFWLVKDENGTQLTFRDLVDKGINQIHVYYEPSTNLTGYGMSIRMYEPFVGDTDVWVAAVDFTKYNGTVVEQTYSIDTGTFLVNAVSKGVLNSQVMIAFYFDVDKKPAVFDWVKLKLEIYAVSEKPVLKGLAEPVYSVVAGLYAAFLAAVNRVKQYVMSAAAGFATSFTFTGLIGDPVVALVVTIIIVTVVFILIKKK